MDYKKRVLVESGAEETGKELEMKRVSAAIRMLGSSFFQEYTSGKREKGQKTYDHMAFGVDDHEDSTEDMHWEPEETLDEEALETLAMEDDDASLVLQFENAVMDAIQDDKELATYFVSYQDARRRIMEKTRSRGFWPSKPFKGGKKGRGKGIKGKTKSLAQRIASSNCRLCGQPGHWKAECPNKKSVPSNEIPTSFVIDLDSCLRDIPEVGHATPTQPIEECFTVLDEAVGRVRKQLRN